LGSEISPEEMDATEGINQETFKYYAFH